MSTPTIATRRLVLRALSEGDAVPLHRILNEEEVLRHFPGPGSPSLEKVQKLVAGQGKHWEEHGYGWWAVETGSDGQFIGWCGLQFLPETQEIEVAYLLDRAFWGQGLATEAAKASLQYGFEQLGLDRIVAIVHPENVASQRVIEKLGMCFVDRAHYFGVDCYHYAIDKDPA